MKILVGAAGAWALTAIVVASCLERDQARRDVEEPAYVETTSATTTPPATPAAEPATTTAAATPATTRDSTGGIAPNGAVNGRADEIAGTTSSTTTITSAPLSTPARPRQRNYTPVPIPFERANGDSSTSGTAGTPDSGDVHTDPDGSVINPLTSGPTDPISILRDAGPYAGHAAHANYDPNNRH